MRMSCRWSRLKLTYGPEPWSRGVSDSLQIIKGSAAGQPSLFFFVIPTTLWIPRNLSIGYVRLKFCILAWYPRVHSFSLSDRARTPLQRSSMTTAELIKNHGNLAAASSIFLYYWRASCRSMKTSAFAGTYDINVSKVSAFWDAMAMSRTLHKRQCLRHFGTVEQRSILLSQLFRMGHDLGLYCSLAVDVREECFIVNSSQDQSLCHVQHWYLHCWLVRNGQVFHVHVVRNFLLSPIPVSKPARLAASPQLFIHPSCFFCSLHRFLPSCSVPKVRHYIGVGGHWW